MKRLFCRSILFVVVCSLIGSPLAGGRRRGRWGHHGMIKKENEGFFRRQENRMHYDFDEKNPAVYQNREHVIDLYLSCLKRVKNVMPRGFSEVLAHTKKTLHAIFPRLCVTNSVDEITKSFEDFGVLMLRSTQANRLVLECGSSPISDEQSRLMTSCLSGKQMCEIDDDQEVSRWSASKQRDYRASHNHFNCCSVSIDLLKNPGVVGMFGEDQLSDVLQEGSFRRIDCESFFMRLSPRKMEELYAYMKRLLSRRGKLFFKGIQLRDKHDFLLASGCIEYLYRDFLNSGCAEDRPFTAERVLTEEGVESFGRKVNFFLSANEDTVVDRRLDSYTHAFAMEEAEFACRHCLAFGFIQNEKLVRCVITDMKQFDERFFGGVVPSFEERVAMFERTCSCDRLLQRSCLLGAGATSFLVLLFCWLVVAS